MNLGQELVVLHTKPSMFVKFVVHAWRYCVHLNKEHSILVEFAKLLLGVQGCREFTLIILGNL